MAGTAGLLSVMCVVAQALSVALPSFAADPFSFGKHMHTCSHEHHEKHTCTHEHHEKPCGQMHTMKSD